VTAAHTLDAASAIRDAGLRLTDSRRAVFEALREQSHASADALYQRVAHSVPSTSMQSIYNALGDFVDAGLVRRIEPAGLPMLFELRVSDNHHHLICRSCGAIEDIDCVVGDAPCLVPDDSHGFAIDIAEVTFWGICGLCAASGISLDSPTPSGRKSE
jgi:Fur family transcriptional regulator, stress-responsive regulator